MTWSCNNSPLTSNAKNTIFNHVGDDECVGKASRGEAGTCSKFVDPLLTLHKRGPLMYTLNTDVPNGLANGTLMSLVSVMLKRGAHQHIERINVDGSWVRDIDCEHVDHLVVELTAEKERQQKTNPSSPSPTAKIFPQQHTVSVHMPFEIIQGEVMKSWASIKMQQFSVLVNHATTVHKLQGQTVTHLYVSNLNYTRNWIYVALSRVKTRRGLYLRSRIDRHRNLRPHSDLKRMLNHFKSLSPVNVVDEEINMDL